MFRSSVYTLSALALVVTLVGCDGGETPAPTPETPAPSPDAPASDTSGFEPVPLPNPGIPGYNFPEAEQTIDGWISAGNSDAINLHAWGIWTSLTAPSGQYFNGRELLVFETWLTPQDIISLPAEGVAAATSLERNPRPVGALNQLQHASLQEGGTDGEETILGFVKYDPTAAAHAEQDDLFSVTKLNSYLAAGDTKIPDFPDTAVALKPVFQVMTKLVEGRYYRLAAWPGPPNPAKAFPSQLWGQCVWVDTQESGFGGGDGTVDTTCARDGSSRTAETTYGLGQFINYQLSAQDAAEFNAANNGANAAEGNWAILQAMHVSSREITRWTWQTFWWTPTPDDPHLPSSAAIAADRPSQLQGAPRNYAHCPAYQMVDPVQPLNGGTNDGVTSVYCYNPWLEAGFGPSVLPASTTVGGVLNNHGVQTNCMSCHGTAAFAENNSPNLTSTHYTGDRYVSLDDPQFFQGNLQVDFLWSIPGNAQ